MKTLFLGRSYNVLLATIKRRCYNVAIKRRCVDVFFATMLQRRDMVEWGRDLETTTLQRRDGVGCLLGRYKICNSVATYIVKWKSSTKVKKSHICHYLGNSRYYHYWQFLGVIQKINSQTNLKLLKLTYIQPRASITEHVRHYYPNFYSGQTRFDLELST